MTSLSLLQLVSPALPVGAFSYSEGLEVLIQSGAIGDDLQLQGWLEAELQRGALRLEACALPSLARDVAAWFEGDAEAKERLIDLDSWLLATREASDVRSQQRQMGQSLTQLLTDMGRPLPQALPLSWPAAWAAAALALEVSPKEMLEGYLYGWVANQLSAAVRLLPLGPTRAQVLQHRLQPLIKHEAEQLLRCDPRTLWNGGVGAGMAQLAHAELYSRLFRS